MILLIYALFFIASTIGTLIPEDFISSLQIAFQNEHPKIARPCALITNVVTHNQTNSSVVLLNSIEGLNLEQVSEKIQDISWCLVAIFDTRVQKYDFKMSHIKNLVEKILDHVVFVVGSFPHNMDLTVWNEAIFWIQPIQPKTYVRVLKKNYP